MTDIVSPAVRSRMMSNIRGKDTKPELVLRKALHARGFRYRLNARDLPGSPDIVLPKWRAVLFVHGCYWHRHPGCPKATMPSSNVAFWREKFAQNVARDRRNLADLMDLGWRVGIVWECVITKMPPTELLPSIEAFISGGEREQAEFS